MDQLKCEHFPDFIFNSGILLDVAYGTTNIKCDHITSHMKHKHIHMLYWLLCLSMLLVHILKCVRVLNSSLLVRVCCIELYHRKSLSGLDDIMAYGLIVWQFIWYDLLYFTYLYILLDWCNISLLRLWKICNTDELSIRDFFCDSI